MFWKRGLRPPLSARQRVDLELLLRRTVDTVGVTRVRNADWILELDELKLKLSSTTATLDSVNQMLLRILPECKPPPITEVVAAESINQPSIYKPAVNLAEQDSHDSSSSGSAKIKISEELLSDPLRLVMELAGQHSLHFWHHVNPKHSLDLTPLTTQLLPICCGLGVLASDASLYDSQWSLAGYSGWTLSRSGYYTAQEIGYALATLARLKEDLPSNWLDRLRPDSRNVAEQSLHRYHQTDQQPTLFDAREIPSSKCSPQQLSRWLVGECIDFSLAAMEAMLLQDRPLDGDETRLLELSRNRDLSIVHAATRLMSKVASPSQSCQRRLSELIKNRDAAIAVEAIHASIKMGLGVKVHGKRIGKMIDRLGCYGQDLLSSLSRSPSTLPEIIPVLCRQLEQSSQEADAKEWTVQIIACLERHASNSNQCIKRYCSNPNEILSRLTELGSSHSQKVDG